MSTQTDHQAIAVTGMACRFPGDADSPGALWRLLAEGRDAVSELPQDRARLWGPTAATELRETDANGPLAALHRGGFLRDVTGFDAAFFGISGREADLVDPQHRLLLEVAWQALEQAGLPPDTLAGTSTGVFAGLSYTEYMERLAGQPEELEGSVLANGSCVAGGRISYLLGLRGPCVVLDTACSSSLVALHLACQALRAHECDIALAGGVSLILSPRMTLSFARMGMLSPAGRCQAFDAGADGFVRGEGCGVVVLRRVADAAAGGERILALVRGSAVNQDGRSDGLAAPSGDAQRALYADALKRAGVDPVDIGMIEAHGTGTPVGDPVEFASLAAAYGDGRERCALTSVKTNLGHLEPAAGIGGLIKAVLCLRQGLIPPNLHFRRWNPALDAEGSRFFVPTELASWPGGPAARLAAVSSFGFSGTNAHVLLEQAPGPGLSRRVKPSAGKGAAREGMPRVIVIPAGSGDVLPEAAERLADWLEADGAQVPLTDIAYTLSRRRSHGRGRLGVVARSHGELVGSLRAFAAGQAQPWVVSGSVGAGVARRPVWVFSGQGSQWPGMGRRLLRHDAAFAAALTEADGLIAGEAGFSVLDVIRQGQEVTGCAHVQPVLFAMQVALAAAWRACGVEPAGVIGHSMGEVAAAVVAGALTMADGVRVICRRSKLLTRIAGAGAMATVGLDADAAESELAAARLSEKVSVAVLAAPGYTVVAGDAEAVIRLTAAWEARGVPARLVAVDVASHSPQVDPLLDELTLALAGMNPRLPRIPFYSTVCTLPGEPPGLDAAYWCANLRSPVRFAAAVAAAAADRHSVFLEVSPHPVVTRAISDCLTGLALPGLGGEPVVLPTLRRGEDELATFRTQLAAAHCAGVTLDWRALCPEGQLADVPPITLDRKRHWVEITRQARANSVGLPGQHTEVPGQRPRHCWRGDVGTAAIGWLGDHKVHGRPVLPGAVHAALAVTAACQWLGAEPGQVEVTDLQLRDLLPLTEHTEVTTVVTVSGDGEGECEISSRDESGGWTRHATATVRQAEPDAGRREDIREVPSLGSAAALYAGMRSRGIEHGPGFNCVTGLHLAADGRTAWASVRLPAAAAQIRGLRVQPALLDACAQVLAAILLNGPGSGLILPVGIGAIRVRGDLAGAAYCCARIDDKTEDRVTGRVRLLDASGATLASLDGVRLALAPWDAAVSRWFLEPAWHIAPRRPQRPTALGTWLICGSQTADIAGDLSAALRTAGAVTKLAGGPAGLDTEPRAGDWAAIPAPRALVVVQAPEASQGEGDLTDGALARAGHLLAVAATIAATWAEPPRLYVVTCGAQPVLTGEPVSLGQGAIRGLIRVLACEHPRMRATQVDISPLDVSHVGADLADLADELLSDSPEDEVALRGGARYTARLEYSELPARGPAPARIMRYGTDGFRLRASRLGELGAVELVATPRRSPGPGEVELRVQAAGLNFRDVLTIMGLLDASDDARYRIGFECAGVITQVGPGVTDARAGDQVLAIDLRGGSFGSFVTLPASDVERIPEGLEPAAAAGVPAAFMTAWYALRHLARLRAGERVLIHSAAGGTGMAAVAVARLIGAEVLATAGSEDKRRFLREAGIAHVMDSRSTDFARAARAATGGQGVDVVLNSLPGAAIRAGLETLRPFGRFIELGVRDILADAPLGMLALRHNITLSTVDLIELRQSRPELFTAVLREVLAEFTAGNLAPLPHRAFPLTEAADVLGLMARASHTGKLVLTVPDDGHASVVPGEQPARPECAYIITGGLRGVGLATAQWLALGGAGHVVVNGRGAPSEAAEQALARLREAGSQVTVVLGDIAEPGTAERCVAAATSCGFPLRGIVHSAMVLDDAAIINVTSRQLAQVWRPKVTGAWRLHEATAGHELDWFVLYSSMASLVGNPGQGAYAAANSWLDAFAAWRTAQGMPATAVNWGPWGETGVATGFAARGYKTIPTSDGLRALGTLLAHQRIRTGVIPGDPQTWIPPNAQGSTLLAHLVADGRTAGQPGGERPGRDIRATLASTEPGLARRNVLEVYLADQIRNVLRLGSATLDPQTPLQSLGFDSLLSIELGNRLEAGLGIKLAAKFVWKHPTLAALGDAIAEHMGLDLNS